MGMLSRYENVEHLLIRTEFASCPYAWFRPMLFSLNEDANFLEPVGALERGAIAPVLKVQEVK